MSCMTERVSERPQTNSPSELSSSPSSYHQPAKLTARAGDMPRMRSKSEYCVRQYDPSLDAVPVLARPRSLDYTYSSRPPVNRYLPESASEVKVEDLSPPSPRSQVLPRMPSYHRERPERLGGRPSNSSPPPSSIATASVSRRTSYAETPLYMPRPVLSFSPSSLCVPLRTPIYSDTAELQRRQCFDAYPGGCRSQSNRAIQREHSASSSDSYQSNTSSIYPSSASSMSSYGSPTRATGQFEHFTSKPTPKPEPRSSYSRRALAQLDTNIIPESQDHHSHSPRAFASKAKSYILNRLPEDCESRTKPKSILKPEKRVRFDHKLFEREDEDYIDSGREHSRRHRRHGRHHVRSEERRHRHRRDDRDYYD